MPALTVKDIPSQEIAFKRYAESGSWQCSKGGAHFWLPTEGKTWRCRKCGQPREFHCPDYVWNDRMDVGALFGVKGLFDAMQRSLV